MKRQPYFGWKDCKLHLFHAKHATPKQREALAPYEGIKITGTDGGSKALEAIQVARRIGITIARQSFYQGRPAAVEHNHV